MNIFFITFSRREKILSNLSHWIPKTQNINWQLNKSEELAEISVCKRTIVYKKWSIISWIEKEIVAEKYIRKLVDKEKKEKS